MVIGKVTRYVNAGDALAHVAGFALHNDYSERAFQMERGGQWSKGKSADSFAPFGPFVATVDELPNFGNLAMWLDVNGQRKQDSNTSNMIFDVPFLVSYVSQFMTLLPGDVISTGTPAGVGLGHKPPQYLHAGRRRRVGNRRPRPVTATSDRRKRSLSVRAAALNEPARRVIARN